MKDLDISTCKFDSSLEYLSYIIIYFNQVLKMNSNFVLLRILYVLLWWISRQKETVWKKMFVKNLKVFIRNFFFIIKNAIHAIVNYMCFICVYYDYPA